jgi:hypothetical protein
VKVAHFLFWLSLVGVLVSIFVFSFLMICVGKLLLLGIVSIVRHSDLKKPTKDITFP